MAWGARQFRYCPTCDTGRPGHLDQCDLCGAQLLPGHQFRAAKGKGQQVLVFALVLAAVFIVILLFRDPLDSWVPELNKKWN